MFRLIAFFALLSLSMDLFAMEYGENGSQKILIKDGFFGKTYTHKGKDLSIFNIGEVINPIDDQQASSQLSKAKGFMYVALPLSFAGGAMIGYSIGSGDYNTTVLGIGGGLLVVGIIFGTLSDNALENSIDRYNTILEKKLNISIKENPGSLGLNITYGF